MMNELYIYKIGQNQFWKWPPKSESNPLLFGVGGISQLFR